jgi:hypothetical protein
MSVRPSRKTRAPFRTVVTILMAAVTAAGASIAWRISSASGRAEAADAEGLTAALNSANVSIATSTYLSNNIDFFKSYRQHLTAASLLEKQALATGDPGRRLSLRDAARRERNIAATFRSYIDTDYLEVDPSDGSEFFNGNRYWEAQLASERALKALDEKPFFGVADSFRGKARRLAGVTVALSLAVFLLAAATTTRRRARYYFAGLASLVFALCCLATILLEFSH